MVISINDMRQIHTFYVLDCFLFSSILDLALYQDDQNIRNIIKETTLICMNARVTKKDVKHHIMCIVTTINGSQILKQSQKGK